MQDRAINLPVKGEAPASLPADASDWRPFESFRSHVDRLIRDIEAGVERLPIYRDVDSFFRRGLAVPVTPAVDLTEKNGSFQLTAELPGLRADDIELSFADDVLTIKGQKREEHEEKSADRYVSERSFGSFRRAMQLPSGIDAAKIKAKYKDGVLTVDLPRTAEAAKKQTRIAIAAN